MNDTAYGTRNKRGDWKPSKRIEYPPVFVWPPNPRGFVKWLFGYPGYILPWNLFYAALAALVWIYATPPLDTMRNFGPDWIGFLLIRNAVLAVLFFGGLHLLLYVRRVQGNQFKYNAKWLDTDNGAFLFRNQTIDNLIWSLGSGVPIWTAYEAVTLWAYANGYIPSIGWEQHPIYFVALLVLTLLFREVHFYLVHRLIHWPPFYRTVHRLHHHNVNPGPWSGLAMHPVEHLLYFSGILIHWIVPSHPFHALFHVLHAGVSPAPAHSGFDRILLDGRHGFEAEGYAHYLHHKFFECNYADGALPIDKWFGTFHDGSEEAQEAMDRRFLAQARKGQQSKVGS